MGAGPRRPPTAYGPAKESLAEACSGGCVAVITASGALPFVGAFAGLRSRRERSPRARMIQAVHAEAQGQLSRGHRTAGAVRPPRPRIRRLSRLSSTEDRSLLSKATSGASTEGAADFPDSAELRPSDLTRTIGRHRAVLRADG